jgi:hypothetical protein
MIIKCPNVTVSALPHIADYLRQFGASVTFLTPTSGLVQSSSGDLDFSHNGDAMLTITVLSNANHFSSRLLVGGIRQVVEEVCEKLKKDSLSELVCVIPAYNEGKNIAGVVEPVVQSGLFGRVIVVDDGSDNAMYSLFGEVVYRMPQRVGKSKAVAYGLSALKGISHVCLLDADLVGLTKQDLAALVAPIYAGKADASLSARKSYGGLWAPDLDIFTGERVLPLELLLDCDLGSLDSMGMEMAINQRLIETKARIAVVPWPHVTNPTKVGKYGVKEGIRREAEMYKTFWKKGPVEIMQQALALRRQVI